MAEENNGLNIFGWTLSKSNRNKKDEDAVLPSIVAPTDEDGAGYVTISSGSSAYNQILSFDLNSKTIKDDRLLILKYREAAMHPEVDQAINHIINEAISSDQEATQLDLDKLDASASIKKKIESAYDEVIRMLDFNNNAADMFRRFYIDGRLYHHLVVDGDREKLGIQEIRYIDSVNISKVKEVIKEKDHKTQVEVVVGVKEYYIYEHIVNQSHSASTVAQKNAIKLSNDSVSYVTSGVTDTTRSRVVGHLDKVLKPLNQLRMMEDAQVIFRLSRAPERRIFYVDVGGHGANRAETYMCDIAAK